MHVPFDPDSEDWRQFFNVQYGGADAFIGTPFLRGQYGTGIGSVFSSIFRFLLPIGKQIGRELGKEGINTGARVLNRLASGENLKNSLLNESQQGIKNLVDAVYEHSQKGQGRKRKTTSKKTIKGSKKVKSVRFSKIGPPKKADFLGPIV